jgi:hypothetical protein
MGKSRKRQAQGHRNYGLGLIKEGVKEIFETTAGHVTHGIPEYAGSTLKIVKGIKHLKKAKELYK